MMRTFYHSEEELVSAVSSSLKLDGISPPNLHSIKQQYYIETTRKDKDLDVISPAKKNNINTANQYHSSIPEIYKHTYIYSKTSLLSQRKLSTDKMCVSSDKMCVMLNNPSIQCQRAQVDTQSDKTQAIHLNG